MASGCEAPGRSLRRCSTARGEIAVDRVDTNRVAHPVIEGEKTERARAASRRATDGTGR